jgi:transglutaminase-like putative cysteine protease
VDEAATVLDRIEAMDRYDPTPASERMQLCALRGEVDGVRAAGAALLDAYPEDLATALKVASALFTAGAGEDALVLLHRLADEAPHHPRVTESLGRTLEALERRDEAIAMYRRTVDLEPQNQPLARYVEFLEERDGLERRWAVEFDAEASGATAARAELAAMSAADREKLRRGRALFRQEVDLIHPNGLSSRMGQSFTLVQTEDGAEQFRQTQVPFTPGEEDFELLRAVVHKPDGHRQDYEVHYPVSFGGGSYFSDMGAEFVAFPRLGVGDVVELRYRIDNRSRRNKFGEHYSREVWVLNTNPTDRFRYVLTAPEDKVLRIHVPDGFTPRVTESREDGMHTRIYELTGLPAIPEEPNAPPMGELARPIELTTFADWAELGRWWWNLAREQLLPDEAIRRRVAEITDGADGVEEKVYRIFDWAIRNTRYVALEFGIHGWKPYRANEVISRGFGDCKDKAGLLYTMLAAAGIDSRMVLLRTRHYSGFPTSDHPSLGQFDHAILYVPGLDLFLDGTVTQAAATELPVMDRQAMALVVGPDGVDRVTTPLEPRSPDRSEADFDFTIDAGGDATLSAALTTRGHYASGLRGRLEAAETRRQRTEEMLNGDFPGLSLATLDVQGLEDFRLPVSATLTASVPDLAVGTGGRFSLRIGRGGGLARRLAAAATRELDVEIYSPIREHRSFRYRLPEGAAEIEIPRSIEARDGDRLFRIETRLEGREVHVTVELAIPDTRIPRAQYAAFRTFLAAVDTATSEPITYAMP